MVNQVGRPTVPLFALIIGIDDYPKKWKLSGAVTDAKAIKQYLEDVLQVSRDHILTLYDQKATRSAIIQAFKDLRDDQRIDKGDPIVIFYSGHGQRFSAPDAWAPQTVIECLIPYDCGPKLDNSPIPDRTIGTLIGDIATEKGDNITVIFDCCFSGSLDRDLNEEESEEDYVPRIIGLDLDIPDTLDADILGSRDATVANGFWYHGLRSHVLLAACDENELAYERKGGGGLFTNALLERLKNTTLNNTTYAELVEGIQLKKQHPQCGGFNQRRYLFNARVDICGQVPHPVQTRQDGKYTVKAGFAHGVSSGVEFTLYDDNKIALGVVPVDETSLIGDFETTVTASIPTDVSFAKFTRVGKLSLYVAEEKHLFETILRAAGYGTSVQAFQLVEADSAKLEIAMEDDRIIFKVSDKLVQRYGVTQLPYKATLAGSLASVLSFAAHYYWFLGLVKEQDSSRGEVTVDFYRLEERYDDFGEPFLLPLEPGLCLKDPNSGSHVIDFIVLPDALFGTKLTNNTTRDLYLNVFLFNNSSLSIIPYYIQSTAGEPEAPLKKGESFTIGYGPGGTPPFSYSFEDGQDVDVGYLKIFFATRPIDLTDVGQRSPFSSINAREGTDDDTPRGSGWGFVKAFVTFSSLPRQPDTWFTLDIPVVQRRGITNS